MSDDNNIFSIHQGGKRPTEVGDSEIPVNPYVIVDINGEEFEAEGFLIFTSQHVAVMRDVGGGTVPVFMMPLNQVRFATLDEEIAEVKLPF